MRPEQRDRLLALRVETETRLSNWTQLERLVANSRPHASHSYHECVAGAMTRMRLATPPQHPQSMHVVDDDEQRALGWLNQLGF